MVAKRGSAAPREARLVRAEDAGSSVDTDRGRTLTALSGDPTAPLALDKVIHERVRLAIVSALAVHAELTFNELKTMLETSDGNLSVHARKLEEAGYVLCTKGFEGRVPRSAFRITPKGRHALDAYLTHMEALIRRVGGA